MSIETANAFMERMKTDEEFCKKMSECQGADACRAAMSAEGFDLTDEDIKFMKESLADEDLAQATGGVASGGPHTFTQSLTWVYNQFNV